MSTTTTLTFSSQPNYHSISLSVEFEQDDDWEASTVVMSGRVQVEGVWFDIHDLVPQAQGELVYYGRIFGLQEGTDYPVEITWTRTADDNGEILETVQTTETVTTRTSPTETVSDRCHVAPSGGSNLNSGVDPSPTAAGGSGPKNTIRDAAFFGDQIALVPGTYTDTTLDFDDDTDGPHSPHTAWSGTDGAYKSIVAINGAVVISGGRAMGGSWTRAADSVYYHTLTGFTKTGASTNGPGLIRRETESGSATRLSEYYVLHLYSSVATLTTGAFGEGFVVDWTNSRIYVRTPADDGPSTTQYVASAPVDAAMVLTNCDYVIIDGLNFDMFAQCLSGGTDSSTHTTKGALTLNSCTNIVIRNCTFTVGGIVIGDQCSKITIEDCTFTDYDPWARVEDLVPTITTAFWTEYKESVRNERSGILAGAGEAQQLVVRRCTFNGQWTSLNLEGGSGADYCDIYENTFTRNFDDTIECDGSGGSDLASGRTNGAFWHNTFEDVGSPFSFSPFQIGPAWCIANHCVDYWLSALGPVRKGSNSDSIPARGDGWLFFYNNTCYNSLRHVSGTTAGNHCWISNRAQSNSRYINNIFVGTGRRYTDHSIGTLVWSGNNPDVLFTNNAFYTTFATPVWKWDDAYPLDYNTWEELNAAVTDLQLQMTGNVGGTNPFPNGIDGGLHPLMRTFATDIKGITTIAANDGVPFGVRKPIGYFNSFAYPSERIRIPSRRRSFIQDSNT